MSTKSIFLRAVSFLAFAFALFLLPSSAHATANPGPQWILQFENNYNDTSGNNISTINNGTTFVNDGTRGNVASFTGSNYIPVQTSLPASYTKSAWVFVPTGTSVSSRHIISGTGSDYFMIQGGFLAAAGVITSGTAFPINSWVHVALTFNSSNNQWTIYQNGTQVAQTTAGAVASSTVMSIGGYNNSGSFGFSGYIDDAELWNVALTSTQITALVGGDAGLTAAAPSAPTVTAAAANGKVYLKYNAIANASAITDYIIEYKLSSDSSWTTFSDGTSTTPATVVTGLTNSSSYDFRVSAVNSIGTGSVSTTVTTTPSLNAFPAPTFFYSYSGDFSDSSTNATRHTNGGVTIVSDGTRGNVGNYAGSPANMVVTGAYPSTYTKTTWLFAPTGTALNSKNFMSSSPGNYFYVNNSKLATGDDAGGVASNLFDFPLNTWVHVAMVYNGSGYLVYQNGVLVATGGAGSSAHSGTNIEIGSYASNFFWLGKMDDTGFYNTALTAAQINALYLGESGVVPAVTSAPQNLVASKGNTSGLLAWQTPYSTGGSAITDYTIQYKLTSDSTWTTFSHSASTATTSTITGLTNGSSYDFRVAAVNGTGTSVYSNTSSVTPGAVTYYHILSNGQSLAIGYAGTPALSTSQLYNNQMLSGGYGGAGTATPLIPLTENTQETPSSGIANTLSASGATGAQPVVVGLHGITGTAYAGLKKGTSAYTNGMTQATNTKAQAIAAGGTYVPLGVTIVHGEQDYGSGNSSVYEGYLQQWQNDYQTDIDALINSSTTIPMFISQMNQGTTGEMAEAQFSAHKDTPGKIIMIGPKYQYGFQGDGVHLTNTYYRYMGEMFAKVIKKVSLDHQTWNPLMPTALVRNANVITISYNIPVGTLNLDTTTIAQRTNYGFEFVQTGGNSPTISSVQLINSNTQVQITLSATPTGTSQQVRYASTCYGTAVGGTWCGGGAGGASDRVGGNLRDTDSSVSLAADSTGLPLYDFSVAFTEPVTTATVPGAPTGATATAGNASATVSFTAPASNGGAAITGYTVTSIPAGGTDTNAGTTGLTHTITGLTNGTSYTFTVVATNSIGDSAASSASNSVTPVPPVATTFTFTGPSSGNVNAASTNFTVTPNSFYTGTITITPTGAGSTGLSATVLTFSSSATPQTFAITPTVAGSITLTPTNNGSLTNPSNLSYTANAVAPGAPTGATATAGNAQATVTFTAPASNGGAAITGYTVTSIPGGGTDSNAGSTSLSHVITGLTNGTSYTFTITATNSAGTSSASSASNSVTPLTVPGAPTSVIATPGNASASVAFTAPASNGGATITGYTVTSIPAGGTDTNAGTTGLTHSITGLTNGTSYTFTVTATNSAGTSSASSPSSAVIPVTTPGAPTSVVALTGNTQATVTFVAPASNGGATITGYTVTSIPSGGTDSNAGSTGLSHVITGLTNNTVYTFTVRATNSAGAGTVSAASNTVTPFAPTVPSAPAAPSTTTGDGTVTLNWTAPFSGGATITDYLIEYKKATDSVWTTFVHTASAAVTATISGLTNAVAYNFRISAINSVGTSTASSSATATPAATANTSTVGITSGGSSVTTSTLTTCAIGQTFNPSTGFPCPITSLPSSPSTPATVISQTSYNFTQDLKKGDISSEVKKLQQFLNTHGYPVAKTGPGSKGKETNVFGPALQAALMKFQNAHAKQILKPAGLKKAPGTVGASTRKYINSL